MPNTPRTLSYLLNNEFQDGQPINSISPQYLRDMIVTWGYRTLPSVMEYGAVGDGVTDDTAAFNAALAANTSIVIPPLKFAVSNAIVNSGNAIIGLSSVAAAYPGNAASEAGTTLSRPVVQAVSGAARIFNVDNAYSYEISGLLIDGISSSGPNGIEQPTFANKSAGTIRDCIIINCHVGANINYGTIHAYENSFGNCGTGMSNPLDSMIADNDFAGNTGHGLTIGSGAGSTTIVGNRFEWNGFAGINLGNGSLSTGASSVTITGNWFDRNGWAGVAIEPAIDVSITGNTFRRNGRLDNSLWTQCHIYLYASSRVAISGNTTAIGADDNGTGTITPRYAIGFDNPPGSAIAISGNQLTGYTVAVTSGVVPADTTTSATTHVTSGTAVLTSLSTDTTACVGQRVTGTGIPVGSTIHSVDSASQVTMELNNTATNTTVAVTFKGDYTQTGNST